MLQRGRRGTFTNGLAVLLSLGREQSAVRSSNSRKCSLQRGAEAISASSLTAAMGQVTRYGQIAVMEVGRRDERNSSQSWRGGTLTAPRQLTTPGHAPNALPAEIRLIANVLNRYRAGPNCAPA